MSQSLPFSPIEVQKFLAGLNYPVSKDELAQTARNEGAPEHLVQLIHRLPGDRFQSPAEVMTAYGNMK
jgi:hypothetical protein